MPRHFFMCKFILTLNVRGTSYLGFTRSISWLLMPWVLTLPGHQQPWHWLYRICSWGRSLSTCVISIWGNDIKCKCMFIFILKNLARKGFNTYTGCHQPICFCFGESCIFVASISRNYTKCSYIPMAWCKTAVSPLLMRWGNRSLAFNHRYSPLIAEDDWKSHIPLPCLECRQVIDHKIHTHIKSVITIGNWQVKQALDQYLSTRNS